ncbi:MAG: hypothetical protein WBX27_18765, partial [Specibacter sp.]
MPRAKQSPVPAVLGAPAHAPLLLTGSHPTGPDFVDCRGLDAVDGGKSEVVFEWQVPVVMSLSLV